MKQEKEQEEYKEILETEFKRMRDNSITNSVKIDSEFIKKYYGAVNQAKLGLKALTEFEDALLMNGLSGLDCEALGLDFSDLSQEEFEHFPFDSKTVFSKETIEQFHPEYILERGKNFGLELAKIGLTGKGVHIAIRDQNCNPYLTDANVVEYTRIKDGETYHEVNPNDVEHMHGVTTTSLLASKTCGVAKDASVHFFNGSINEYVENIIAHNQKCRKENRESDMILVASGSWRDKEFEKHRDELREAGCELVCANNFNEKFGEFINNGGKIENPLDISFEDMNDIIDIIPRDKDFPRTLEQIKTVSNPYKIKIPISRTYHQVRREEGGEPIFKYQSAFSTSWGVPQVAGLLAVFKELDRSLTFEQFLEYARESSENNKMHIINPSIIYQKISEKIREKSNGTLPKEKSGLDDCMKDSALRTSNTQEATRVVKEEVLGKDSVIDENTQQK